MNLASLDKLCDKNCSHGLVLEGYFSVGKGWGKDKQHAGARAEGIIEETPPDEVHWAMEGEMQRRR